MSVETIGDSGRSAECDALIVIYAAAARGVLSRASPPSPRRAAIVPVRYRSPPARGKDGNYGQLRPRGQTVPMYAAREGHTARLAILDDTTGTTAACCTAPLASACAAPVPTPMVMLHAGRPLSPLPAAGPAARETPSSSLSSKRAPTSAKRTRAI
eukprot:CAMPEP_0181181022 /NCGR_PEP_ID=MMETSP1096-20121128/7117_1 /TAXON_ID=156174 ORGANISM="Chrysochromulina ericina, Strain CCMP281" /NCGR_SAMPLE_ID=MMETSP1096 /ASSEMBLY_ACC=CAM_ASM_000453 /LENGTH=155 /DNA_ID=CAMNT_0023269501 /DNA_START=132 /DNA_END=599 /DNA_ORIENTATION=+